MKRLLVVLALVAGFAVVPATASASPWYKVFGAGASTWSTTYLNPVPSNFVWLDCNQSQFTYNDGQNARFVLANRCNNAPLGRGDYAMNAPNWVCVKEQSLSAQKGRWLVTKHVADCDFDNGFNDPDTQVFTTERVYVTTIYGYIKAIRVENQGTLSGLTCSSCNMVQFTAVANA